jgi:hypothetical protein
MPHPGRLDGRDGNVVIRTRGCLFTGVGIDKDRPAEIRKTTPKGKRKHIPCPNVRETMLDTGIFLIGAAALMLGLMARTLPSDRWLTRVNIVSLLLWATYFCLIGGYGAVTSLLIGVAVALSAELRMTSLSRGLLALEFVMIPVIGTLAGPREILPLIGGVTFSTGVAFLSGTRLTLVLLAGEGIWLSYAIWTGAMFGVLAALAAMSALLVRSLRRWLARSAP